MEKPFFLEKYFTKVMNPNNMEPVSSEVVIPIDETEMLPQDMMLEEEEEKLKTRDLSLVHENVSDEEILEMQKLLELKAELKVYIMEVAVKLFTLVEILLLK